MTILQSIGAVIKSKLDLKANIDSPTFAGNVTLPSSTTIGNLSSTELNYLDGVTSNIQTQINTKANINSPTFTGEVVLPSSTTIGNLSSTELNYLDGVTSNIQTQINTKANYFSPTFAGNVTLPSSTTIGNLSSTELNYLDGVTSNIQTQINTKANIDSPTFTGYVNLPASTTIGNISSTELNYLDGVTSNIQTQLNAKMSAGDTTFNSVINANAGLAQDGFVILNGSDTWLRTSGSTGWYNATYGGGMFMEDSTWVKTYNNKSLYSSGSLFIGASATIRGDLNIGGSQNATSIIMGDNDEGQRYIHCNSNRIGFLNQSNGWGSWCNDDGSFENSTYMSSPTIYSNVTKTDLSCRDAIWYQSSCDAVMKNTYPHTKNMREINGFSDAPNKGWWFLETMRHSNSSNFWGAQKAYGWEDNAGKIYYRTISNGAWSSWINYTVFPQPYFPSTNYSKLPGGLIIQWGYVWRGNNSNVYTAFPISFPTAFLNAQATLVTADNLDESCSVNNANTVGMYIRNSNGPASYIYWMALGY